MYCAGLTHSTSLLLEINGFKLDASEVDATIAFENLAAGVLNESELPLWFEKHCINIK